MPGSKNVLGITGSFGYIGKRLMERLKKSDEFHRIICTDILSAPGNLPDHFESHVCDIRDGEKLYTTFKNAGVNVVIHLAFIAYPTRNHDFEYDVDVNGTQNVLAACKKLETKKLVVASSDCAYGFFEGTPDYLSETAPIRSTPGFPYSENKAAVEKMISDFDKDTPGCSVVIIRPCIVLGPNANSTTARSMKEPVIIGVRGYDPIMQVVHEDDAAEAFYLAAVKDVSGAFNLAAGKGFRYSKLAKEVGRPIIFLPVWMIYPFVEMLYRLRILPFGKAQLDYIRYPLSISIDKIQKELGFQPRYDSRQTIRSFLSSSV